MQKFPLFLLTKTPNSKSLVKDALKQNSATKYINNNGCFLPQLTHCKTILFSAFYTDTESWVYTLVSPDISWHYDLNADNTNCRSLFLPQSECCLKPACLSCLSNFSMWAKNASDTPDYKRCGSSLKVGPPLDHYVTLTTCKALSHAPVPHLEGLRDLCVGVGPVEKTPSTGCAVRERGGRRAGRQGDGAD